MQSVSEESKGSFSDKLYVGPVYMSTRTLDSRKGAERTVGVWD